MDFDIVTGTYIEEDYLMNWRPAMMDPMRYITDKLSTKERKKTQGEAVEKAAASSNNMSAILKAYGIVSKKSIAQDPLGAGFSFDPLKKKRASRSKKST